MNGLIDTLFNPLSWIIAPVIAFLISFFGLRRNRIPIRLGASLLFSLAALLFFFFGTWNWLLRDGLGPGMIESHGWKALEHFFDLTTFVIYGVPFFAAVLLCLKDRLIKPPRRAAQD
jgi:hypothetical protein